MRPMLPALLLLAATACRTSAPEPAPAPSAAKNATSEPSLSLEELLKRAQAVSGANFTYAADVAEVLRTTPAAVAASTSIPAAEIEPLLRRRLDAAGLECVPVGPEHLRVLLVRRKSA